MLLYTLADIISLQPGCNVDCRRTRFIPINATRQCNNFDSSSCYALLPALPHVLHTLSGKWNTSTADSSQSGKMSSESS